MVVIFDRLAAVNAWKCVCWIAWKKGGVLKISWIYRKESCEILNNLGCKLANKPHASASYPWSRPNTNDLCTKSHKLCTFQPSEYVSISFLAYSINYVHTNDGNVVGLHRSKLSLERNVYINFMCDKINVWLGVLWQVLTDARWYRYQFQCKFRHTNLTLAFFVVFAKIIDVNVPETWKILNSIWYG